jgi:hypothetical protein
MYCTYNVVYIFMESLRGSAVKCWENKWDSKDPSSARQRLGQRFLRWKFCIGTFIIVNCVSNDVNAD